MTAPARDDTVLLVTRLAHAALAVAVVPSFYNLTFHAEATGTNFAWPLAPTMSAMFFGALYFAVIYSFLRVTFAKRWHEIALVLWATLPVVLVLAVVTFLHWEKFAHGTVRFWVWFAAYIGASILLPYILWSNGRRDPRTPNPGDVEIPSIVCRTALFLGIVVGLVGAAMILAPASMAAHWPWPVTPLSAQAVGSLLLAASAVQIRVTIDRRWSAVRIAAQTAILWVSMVIVAVVRGFDQFDTTRPMTWGFLVLLVLEWLLATGTYVVLEGQRRRNASVLRVEAGGRVTHADADAVGA